MYKWRIQDLKFEGSFQNKIKNATFHHKEWRINQTTDTDFGSKFFSH